MLSEDIGKHSKTAEEVMRAWEEQSRLFKDGVGEGSMLLEQLSTSGEGCDHLQTKIATALPLVESLGQDVVELRRKETDLGYQMETLGTKLTEVKLPERFEQDYFHISQKLELENEIEHLNHKLRSTEERLEGHQFESAEKRSELHNMTARAQEEQENRARLEGEIAGFQVKTDTLASEISRLENEVQKLNLALKDKEGKLDAQHLDIQQKQNELQETTTRAYQSEVQVAKLESQAANLEEKLTALRREAQVNLDRAVADSRNKCSAESERRQHELLLEKVAIEADTEGVKGQLFESKRKLVSNSLVVRCKRGSQAIERP